MAQNVIINGVTYQNVPEVDIPKSGGGTAKFYDTATGDAVAGDILTGKTAYGPNGAVSGSMPNNGSTSGEIQTKSGTVTIPAGYTTGGTVSIKASAVSDLADDGSTLLSGKTVLGVSGSLTLPVISQDSTTKVLSIS